MGVDGSFVIGKLKLPLCGGTSHDGHGYNYVGIFFRVATHGETTFAKAYNWGNTQ